MIKYRGYKLFEVIRDLAFLTFLYIIIAFLVYNYTVVYGFGFPIPDRKILLEYTILGTINQYNFFNSIFYLPMYFFKINLKLNIIFILGIFLYSFGMHGLYTFRKIVTMITGFDSKSSVVWISSYLSMLILVFFPFNIYNIGHLVAAQYINPAIQIFLMYSILLEIIYLLVYPGNKREIVHHVLILSILMLFVNYQFFPASLLIYVLILGVTMIFLGDRKGTITSIVLLAFVLLFGAFAATFVVKIYEETTHISYLPEYKNILNTNSVSYTHLTLPTNREV